MKAYVDHNFLINCVDRDEWRSVTTNACKSGSIKLVLSPWSIYEVGNASPFHMEQLLAVIEEFAPLWILERVDLQLREFIAAWNDFWNKDGHQFDPVRTLSEVQASFLHRPIEIVEKYSLRDYATVWTHPDASRDADIEFRNQAYISSSNRSTYLKGKLNATTIRELRERYVALQFAIAGRFGCPHHLIHQYANWILSEKNLQTFISFFVEFGGMDRLLAHRVEEALTFSQWKTDATLNQNRQVDRFHATAALPYCRFFVTSDKELIRKSKAIRGELKFKIATPLSGEEFIQLLNTHA